MNKYFFVIYCEDSNLSTILDGIKLIANPEQGSKTHMTVRGPYTSRNNLGHFHKSWNNVIHGENIEIEGIDKFFNQNQNTVFFRCQETEKLKSIWKKFNYNEFHPHITVYDGKDRDFA
jgi:2'-5' RNA ligase